MELKLGFDGVFLQTIQRLSVYVIIYQTVCKADLLDVIK